MMNKIKLVIWDLDETFWKGTLSEEGVEPVEKNIELVKELTSRGIINSICSKNDFEQAKSELIRLGVWDYFVFPSISWQPKGLQVKNIIEKCQLRAPNVLFLDDNHLNIEEVKYYNEEIYAELPEFIHDHMNMEAFAGKDDSSHSRLKQYKLLEEKSAEKTKYSSNVDFLRDSKIKLRLIKNVKSNQDRVYELLSRTNQLNFTKVRLTEEETSELLANDKLEMFLIHVHDRFGDYGLVGFVCYDSIAHRLEHFTFSCRILNLGIEQYIYRKLGEPDLKISGEVASNLSNYDEIDWIKETDDDVETESEKIEPDSDQNILFVGSCELGAVFNYLQAYSNHIDKHQVRVRSHNIPEFPDHIITLLNFLDLDKDQLDEISELPFLSREYSMSGKIFSGNHDAIIYSVVANYGQNIYKHKTKGFKIAWGEYSRRLTDITTESSMLEYLTQKGFSKPSSFLEMFNTQYEHIGYLESTDFIQNLERLRKNISSNIPIIFINGGEINPDNTLEPEAEKRHVEMNNALDHFLEVATNCHLVDVRNFVTDTEGAGKTIRNYQRHVYKMIADEILDVLKNMRDVKLERNFREDLLIKYNYYKEVAVKSIKTNPYLRNKVFLNAYRKLLKSKKL